TPEASTCSSSTARKAPASFTVAGSTGTSTAPVPTRPTSECPRPATASTPTPAGSSTTGSINSCPVWPSNPPPIMRPLSGSSHLRKLDDRRPPDGHEVWRQWTRACSLTTENNENTFDFDLSDGDWRVGRARIAKLAQVAPEFGPQTAARGTARGGCGSGGSVDRGVFRSGDDGASRVAKGGGRAIADRRKSGA